MAFTLNDGSKKKRGFLLVADEGSSKGEPKSDDSEGDEDEVDFEALADKAGVDVDTFMPFLKAALERCK